MTQNKRYYIAYGSNLSVEQMAHRCPDAKVAGCGILYGWQLMFNGCATIQRNPEKNTPVLIWEISERDEKRLDIYEGYPRYYFKQELEVETFPLDGGAPVNLTAMVYIMSEGFDRGDPTPFYYSILENGYKAFHFPMHVLRQALRDSIGAKQARAFLKKGGFHGVCG